MWAWLFSLIPFLGKLIDPISAITKQIIEWKAKQLNAQTEHERIEAEQNIAVLQIQRDVMVAEAAYNARSNQLIRLGFVIPVATYVWILIMWDKIACKWLPVTMQKSSVCSTDPLDVNMWWIMFAIIAFYFVQNLARLTVRK